MATGGQALQAATAAEQQRMDAETDVAQRVLEQDILEKQREEDEMRALEAAVEERRRELAAATADIGATALEAGLREAKTQALIQGQRDVSPSAVRQLATELDIDEEQARGLFETALENPALLNYFTQLGVEL